MRSKRLAVQGLWGIDQGFLTAPSRTRHQALTSPPSWTCPHPLRENALRYTVLLSVPYTVQLGPDQWVGIEPEILKTYARKRKAQLEYKDFIYDSHYEYAKRNLPFIVYEVSVGSKLVNIQKYLKFFKFSFL